MASFSTHLLLGIAVFCRTAGPNLRLVQEPALDTFDFGPPSWQYLGGDRLVEAAVETGAPEVLLALVDACLGGPYGVCDYLQMLRSCEAARDGELLVAEVGGTGAQCHCIGTASCLCHVSACAKVAMRNRQAGEAIACTFAQQAGGLYWAQE